MSLAEFSLPSEDAIAAKGIQCNEQELPSSSQEQQIDQIPRYSSTKAKPLHEGHWNKIVYPFEWVKPGGVEGETTLEDINRQIRMISAASKPIPHPVKGSLTHTCISARGFGMSGKAVAYVARTRTRGRGSITIIRTKD